MLNIILRAQRGQWQSAVAVSAALLTSLACGNSQPPTAPTPTTFAPTPSPTPISQTVIVSNPAPPSGYDLGRTYQLRAVLRTSGQQDKDITTDAQWSSSNAGVASVSGGSLTIRGLGEVDIAATHENATGTFHVSIAAGQVTFEVDAGVSQSEQDVIRSGVMLAQSYFLSTFSWTPTQPVKVVVRAGTNGPIQAQAQGAQITVYAGNSDWQRFGPEFKRKTLVHEFLHVMQYFLGWIPANQQVTSALWLLEGSAEYVGYLAAYAGQGVNSVDQLRGCHQYRVSNGVRIPRLSELEGQGFNDVSRQGAPVYSIGYLAAEKAAEASGLRSLTTFGLAAATSPWQDAFLRAFGTPLTAFYDAFEQYRNAWRAPGSYTCAS